MKKLLATLLAGVTAFSFAALAGCNNEPSGGTTPETPGGSTTTPETPGGATTPETPGGSTTTPETPGGTTTPEAPTASTKLTGKVYVVGDSTVSSFNDNYYLPRYGYGTQLHRYLNCDANQVVNLALSGRSSLSFLKEGNYNTLKSSISAGDYLVIGFGHNDEKSDDGERYTNPQKTHTDASAANGPSFQYTLYENYVKLAAGKGATPILCTPIVRYDDKGTYTGSVVHNTGNGDYAQAIRTLGAATQTTVIDLTAITRDIYKADNAAAAYYHAHTSYTGEKPNETPSGRDNTHINEYGARMVAYNFAQALKNTDCSLKNHLNPEASAPTYDVDYKAAVVQSYEKPPYTQFKPADYASAKIAATGEGENAVDWYKTAFGDLGGKNNYQYYTAAYENEKFTMGNNGLVNNAGKVAGKFTDTYDTVAGAFIQIAANKNFTASATVKVIDSANASNTQSGYGMMLRDDIYMNFNNNAISTNYVAAGVQSGSAVFSRENAVITREGSGKLAAGSTYELSIERAGQVVKVKCGTFTQTFTDFDFVAVDNDYMYLCLFATRGLVVEFSNVAFEYTGVYEGA